MNVFATLLEKPWENPGLDPSAEETGLRTRAPASIGLNIYMAVMTVIFSILIVTYVLRMGNYAADAEPVSNALPSWSLLALCGIPPARDWLPMPEPLLLWLNTAVLIASSVAWQGARRLSREGETNRLRTYLFVGGALGLLFLGGQIAAWLELNAAGYFLGSNPANAFFYVLTAVHGAHMLGGVFVWGRTVTRLIGGADAEQVHQSVDLNAVYWHYLLVVWIVMFALLVMT